LVGVFGGEGLFGGAFEIDHGLDEGDAAGEVFG
jgi:hypothetical protein